MHRISASVYILRPRQRIYEFTATPRTWRLWHPWCVGLSGVRDRPLAVGEEAVEQVHVAGRRAAVTWVMLERKAPERWVMEASVPGRGQGTLAFHLTKKGKGTLCEREFVYDGVNALVDRLFVRPYLQAEAKESLARLKVVLESGEEKSRRR
jgi:hypothetical protein